MNTMDVTLVRVYLTEEKGKWSSLFERLHDEEKVRGVTVFRGISGFGKSGHVHSSSLLDISLDLPVVIEFFDAPEKVERILEHLGAVVEAGHMVSWSAQVHV